MIAVRVADARDLPLIRTIVRGAYAHYVPRVGREPAPMTADYAALVAAGEVRVAVDGTSVVGVLVLRPVPGAMHLENVAVDPAVQGRGIGRLLVEHAEHEAREAGLPAVELYTNARMTENVALYPRLGYVETGRRSDDGFDRVFFRKDVADQRP
jgi:ribosomal protein S18 acetylase RimI-like enzyme